MNTLPLNQLSAYRAMRDGFARLSLDLDAVLRALPEVPALDAVLPSATLADVFDAAWTAAVERTGDTAIGLRMTPRQPMLGMGGMGHLVLAAPDIRGALQLLSRYTGVISPTTAVGLDVDGRGCRVSVRVSSGRRSPVQQRFDFMAATILQGIRWICGEPVAPRCVHHPFAAPADPTPWRETFDCELRFGAPEFVLEFAPEVLDLAMPTADPTIADLSEQLATRLIQQQGGSLIARVREHIARELARGDPRREQVAAALHLSERTLQRRLAEAGSSFHDLVDDTRREMAQRYLQAGTATPTEIAFALGFADPSNYYRACRRWFGKPPGEVRQPAA